MVCPNKLEEDQQFDIEELNLQQKLPNFRGKRHSLIDPMDMRDFLEPDKYHRYESIVSYLKVMLNIFASIAVS